MLSELDHIINTRYMVTLRFDPFFKCMPRPTQNSSNARRASTLLCALRSKRQIEILGQQESMGCRVGGITVPYLFRNM